MANLLITGGAGYIGSVMSDWALRSGHHVKVVDLLWFKKDTPLCFLNHPDYRFIKGDIRNQALVPELLKDVDYIIHLAAVVGDPAAKKFPELTRSVNYDATVNLIQAAQERKVKGFIFFSTCSNYGVAKGIADENSSLNPLSLYAKTKVDVEHYLRDAKGIDWLICRLSTVYGISPRMRFDLTVNDFTLNAYKSRALDIYQPYTYRPYINTDDVARIIMEMLRDFPRIKNNIFNVGFADGNYQKIKIAEIIKEFLPDLKINLIKSGEDLRDYQVDFSKFKRFLKIDNPRTVTDGVKDLLNVLESQLVADPGEHCYYNTLPDLEADETDRIRRAEHIAS